VLVLIETSLNGQASFPNIHLLGNRYPVFPAAAF